MTEGIIKFRTQLERIRKTLRESVNADNLNVVAHAKLEQIDGIIEAFDQQVTHTSGSPILPVHVRD